MQAIIRDIPIHFVRILQLCVMGSARELQGTGLTTVRVGVPQSRCGCALQAARLVVALIVLGANAPGWAHEQGGSSDRPLFTAGYAVADVLGGSKISATAFEFRSAPKWKGLRGWVAADIGTQNAYFFGAGAHYGIPLHDSFELGLSFGPGYYQGDRRLELGCSVEFRSTLELTYRFRSDQRIALAFGHISNAHLGNVNPGSEFVKILWQFPFGRRVGKLPST